MWKLDSDFWMLNIGNIQSLYFADQNQFVYTQNSTSKNQELLIVVVAVVEQLSFLLEDSLLRFYKALPSSYPSCRHLLLLR